MANIVHQSETARSGISLSKDDSETIVVKARKTVAVYDAVGGPEKAFGTGEYAGGPTSPGEYVIVELRKHISNKWIYSRIAWGTSMHDDGNEISVLLKGKWVNQQLVTGLPRDEVMRRYVEISKRFTLDKIPDNQWIFNDFGHITCYFARDLNQNCHYDKGIESIHNQMFHTTPENEYQTKCGLPVILQPSHGCIHLKPKDIDEMITNGYLKSGNMVYIFEYDLRPFSAPQLESGNPPYSVHFYPGIRKVYIKGS